MINHKFGCGVKLKLNSDLNNQPTTCDYNHTLAIKGDIIYILDMIYFLDTFDTLDILDTLYTKNNQFVINLKSIRISIISGVSGGYGC